MVLAAARASSSASSRDLARQARRLQRLHGFGPAHIGRVLAGEGELRQTERVGAVDEVSPEGISSSVVVTGSVMSEAS